MRTLVGWVGGLAAALGIAAVSAGDEPSRPTASATEAKPAVPAAGHSIHGEAFNDGPRRSATLLPGMGTVPFPVTTSKPEAQAFVNQGVGQLHSFYYFEAERSFRQAAKIDPDCAMTYWGMAMANVNNAKRARGFLAEARKRAATLSRRETLYLEALEAFYKEGADDKARRQGLLLGLEAVVQEFPADLDARAWLAMVTWQNSTKDGIGSRKAVDLVLESVLQAEPMHPGAHHYRIHLWNGDKSIRAESLGRTLRQDRAGDRPRLAHAGAYLHRPEALRRRRLSAGRLGPGRPRRDGPRSHHAVPDLQLRPQQPVAGHLVQPHRPGPRCGRRRPEPGGAAPRSRPERQERRRLGATERPAPLGRGPGPLRTLGRPDRRRLPRAHSTGPTSRSNAGRRRTTWASPSRRGETRRSWTSRSPR